MSMIITTQDVWDFHTHVVLVRDIAIETEDVFLQEGLHDVVATHTTIVTVEDAFQDIEHVLEVDIGMVQDVFVTEELVQTEDILTRLLDVV